MKNRFKWLFGLGLAGLTTLAIAQTTVQVQTLVGTEVVRVAISPGGSDFFVPLFVFRNSASYQLVGAGTTVNTVIGQNVGKLLATSSITTWNIGLPAPSYDGQTIAIACPGGTATTVAVTAMGQTIAGTAFTSCGNGGSAANGAEWIFSASNLTWNRIQ